MNNTSIGRAGVILYALVIGFFGVSHFLHGISMAGMVPSFIPGGLFWVYLTGAALIAAAISFLIGKKTKLAGVLLAIFLLLVVLTIHVPALVHSPDESASRFSLTMLIKDTGLAAAALMIAGKGS
jgi:putative oxidoreductase